MLPTTQNTDFHSVLNGTDVVSGSVTGVNGSILVKGLSNPIDPASISSYAITAYAAGQKKKWTLDFTAFVPADNTQYSITLTKVMTGDPQGIGTSDLFGNKKTYSIFSGVSDTATIIGGKFRAALVADTQAFVVTTGATVQAIVEAVDTSFDFTVDITAVPLTTKTITVAYIAPSGTPTIVGAIDSVNVSSAGQYRTYLITYRQRRTSGLVENSYVSKLQTVVVFADELATNFTAFNSRLTNLLANNPLNNLIQFGLMIPAPQNVAINATGPITAAQMLAGVITSTSAAGTTITTPTATAIAAIVGGAARGTSFELIIDNTAGSSTVTLALDASITMAKQTSSGDSATDQLLTVPSGVTGVGIFRFVFVSGIAATCHRIG